MEPLRSFLVKSYGRTENAIERVGALHADFPGHDHSLLDEATRTLAHEYYCEDFQLCDGFSDSRTMPIGREFREFRH